MLQARDQICMHEGLSLENIVIAHGGKQALLAERYARFVALYPALQAQF